MKNFDSAELLDNYTQVKKCIYKKETYSVRDNGAVLRHKPEGKSKPRPLDEKWTFGKKDLNTGYMLIGSHRVHIIVATAFHGEQDATKLVVDHIDTNRCNNRFENLRWLTRLENALMNPVTFRRIEYLCGGDIQKFIADPSCLRDLAGTHQDVMWMRTVSSEEACNAYARVMEWSKRPYSHAKENTPVNRIGDWIFAPHNGSTGAKQFGDYQAKLVERTTEQSIQYFDSLTPTAKQIAWRTPTEFPLCPLDSGRLSLEEYVSNLGKGKIVTKNEYGCHLVDDFKLVKDKLYIRTHASEGVKPHTLITITLDNGFFFHKGKTFFSEDGSKKYFTLAIGEDWTGRDVFDDYC
ncbi:MAG: HNH endonuclease [Muribaculaceae bacterium]|nr:HNH endonuclease [Muribaculaceae bacterium]